MAGNAVRLTEAITAVLGDATQAKTVVAQALVSSGRSEIPHEPDALLSFVRGYVVERLVDLIGPRSALVFLDDFRAELAVVVPERTEPNRPREPLEVSSRPSRAAADGASQVAVIDRNPYSRADLARALIRGGLSVAAVASFEEDLGEGRAARVLVVRAHRPAEIAGLAAAIRRLPAGFLVLLVDADSGDAADLALASNVRCEIVPASSPVASIADIVFEYFRHDKALGRIA